MLCIVRSRHLSPSQSANRPRSATHTENVGSERSQRTIEVGSRKSGDWYTPMRSRRIKNKLVRASSPSW